MKILNYKEKHKNFKFIKNCVKVCPEILFQCWDSKTFNLTHKNYTEFESKGLLPILFNCDELLRTSIENKEVTELRFDLDFNLTECIEKAKLINNILSLNNININWYSSGGKGIHGQVLIDITKLNLKHDDIKERNKERSFFKKKLCKYLKIYDFNDVQSFSSLTLLGLEGKTMRRKLDKKLLEKGIRKVLVKSNNRKILININQTEKEILNFINENKYNCIINENYFNEINELDYNLIMLINNKLKTYHNPKIKTKPKPKLNLNDTKLLNNHNEPLNSKIEINNFNLAVIELYKKKNLIATHSFTYYLIKFYLKLGLTEINEIKNNINLVLSKLNIYDHRDLTTSIKQVKEETKDINKIWLSFKHNSGEFKSFELYETKNKYAQLLGGLK